MRRWTSIYRFSWKPVITFGTRRLRFLEWVEENLEPVAFSEGHDYVGVALFNRRIRATVRGSSLTLEDGLASDAGVEPLLRAVEGIFEIFEPNSIVLKSATTSWSHGLRDSNYDHARGEFAKIASGFAETQGGLRPVDASALMDLESERASCQVEWGIVSSSELLERVKNPSVGRIDNHRSASTIIGIEASDLPSVSVFVDSAIHRYAAESDIKDAAGMFKVIADVDTVAEGLASDLYMNVENGRGDRK